MSEQATVSQRKAYIGIKPCGCVTFALVAGVDSRREERAELMRVIKSGRTIEVTTTDDARKRMTFDCPHGAIPDDVDAELDRLMDESPKPTGESS